MSTFLYKARDKAGKKVSGTIEAISEKSAADRLVEKGYLPSSIRAKVYSTVNRMLFLGRTRVPPDDMTMFYLQLGNMLDAGLPLLTALRTVQNQIENSGFRIMALDLVKRIENGESFSECMHHHESVFPILYQSMVEVGETSGSLGQVFHHIAELNEAKSELNHEVRSALAYPMVLMLASVAVVILMMVWVIPAFTLIFDKSGIPLPLPTRLIYGLSMFVKNNIAVLIGIFIGLVIGIRYLLKIKSIKHQWDKFWITFPIIGLLTKRIEIARWSRSVALMLSSGVPILKTLEVGKSLTQNSLFEETYEFTIENVRSGGQVAESLESKKILPQDVIQMVSTGENSGTLDKMLYKVAQFYDQLVKRSLKKLTTTIEPIFILFMGGVVGFIMLSILLPIFDMIKIFSPK